MAIDPGATRSSSEPTSLYRRYRPGTFAELRGQDHVVQALRGAVVHAQVAHAYLFSGPRGTGKTSTARILAKALNCLAPVDGEPCGVCASCVEITKGSSMDVIEMDAASNNGVDAIRELISHAALGSPGKSKVYIVDEVHMLSNAAANALLKTLEEPPPHVVFVLATTDPQKVPPTIRSRTQHFEFRLLSADTLEQLVKDVSTDAGLGLDDAALGLAVRKGRGSARDALSALDQVAASGSAEDIRPALIEVLDALCDDDAGRALGAVATLHESGWGPQQLCVELVDELRQAFLVTLSPTLASVEGSEKERVETFASRWGLARIVRAIELLGRSQVDMRDAPDPQVILEVALVRAARPDLDPDVAALHGRMDKLERTVASLDQSERLSPAPGAVPTVAPPVPASDGSLPALGAWRKASGRDPEPKSTSKGEVSSGSRPGTAPDGGSASSASPETTSYEVADPDVSTSLPSASLSSTPEPAGSPTPTPASTDGPPETTTIVTFDALSSAWPTKILSQLKGVTKAMYSPGHFVSLEGGIATFAVPTKPHRDKCIDSKASVERAIADALGAAIVLEIVVDGASRSAPIADVPPSERPVVTLDEEIEAEAASIDLDDVTDAPLDAVSNVAASRILDAFPGAIEEEI